MRNRHAPAFSPRREAGTVGRYLVVALLFALGLMAKPQVITLPLVLLLWDYWPLGRISPSADGAASSRARSFPWLMMEKLPLFALAAASAVVTLLAHRGGALRWLPLSMRIANAIESYARYVKLAFWPSRLALFYPHPGTPLTTWEVLAAFLFLAAVTWLVVEDRRRRYLLVGWLWFLITLLPMIGIVQVGTQAMADRYAYLPFIGLFIMIVWGVGRLGQPAARFREVAGRSGSCRSDCAVRRHASPARLLARQRHSVDAHSRGHARQLHRRS